jgi:hypothetical protein
MDNILMTLSIKNGNPKTFYEASPSKMETRKLFKKPLHQKWKPENFL